MLRFRPHERAGASGPAAVTVESEIYYEPFDVEIHEDPDPTFQSAGPLLVGFYADARRRFADKENLVYRKGDELVLIKASAPLPPAICTTRRSPCRLSGAARR
jgi:hypothetical protein